MKNREKVSAFDFETAFKTLSEMSVPRASKKDNRNKKNISEKLIRSNVTNALMEDYYDVHDVRDLERAQNTRQEEIAQAKLARIEKIVDINAESPEDILPSYVGKNIIQCPQCMTLFYKNPEDVEVSEEDETICNINEVCQHCGNDSGYTIIGKVEAVEEEPEELPVEETQEELPIEEPVEEEPSEEEPVEEEPIEEPSEEEVEEEDLNIEPLGENDEEEKEEVEESVARSANYLLKENVECCEEQEEINEDADAERRINTFLASLDEDLEDDFDISAAEASRRISAFVNSLDEEVEVDDTDIEKRIDAGDHTLEEKVVNEDKIIDDVSSEEFRDMLKNPIFYESFEDEFEDLDECSLNESVSKYLTNVYENVNSFEATDCSYDNNKLTVEGKIKFKSGTINDTKFEFNKDERGFVGKNEDLCEGLNFVLGYSVKDKVIYTESFSYKYNIGKNIVEGIIRK